MKRIILIIITSVCAYYKAFAGYHFNPDDAFGGGMIWLKGNEFLTTVLIFVGIAAVCYICSLLSDATKNKGKDTKTSNTFSTAVGCLTPILVCMAIVCWQIVLPLFFIIGIWSTFKTKR